MQTSTILKGATWATLIAGIGAIITRPLIERHQVLEEFSRQSPDISRYLDGLPMGKSEVNFKDLKGLEWNTTVTKTSDNPDVVTFRAQQIEPGTTGNTQTIGRPINFTLKKSDSESLEVTKDPDGCTCITYKYIIRHPYDLNRLTLPKIEQ